MAKRLTEAELFALGPTTDIPTAGLAWGLGRTRSYEMARAGEFPCEVLPFGSHYVVTKTALLRALGYDPSAVQSASATAA